ncbi:MAG: hypothetical protein AAGF31_04975 [Planctomycetota bacterium]
MAWLVGVDEAGYGPNLGPLVVAATAWRIEAGACRDVDLYEQLGDAVAREPRDERIAIADSKRLYKPGGGLRLLERGFWAAVEQNFAWPALLASIHADPDNRRSELPWHAAFEPKLPLDVAADELAGVAKQLQMACDTNGIAPPMVRARLVFPAEFNTLVQRYDTKGAALSHVTLGLLREVTDQIGDEPVCVTLDKHGGRNRYGPLLQHHFPEHWIETKIESRAESRYAWGPADRRAEVAFLTGGEAFLPAALASMTAKYLRELSMQALNQFWRRHLPDLKPTAGYPVDAKRFKAEIADKQKSLGIDDHILWRCR